MNSQKIIYLTPPSLSDDHIKEKITCIRGHRERIFRVETQLYHNKLICHNYGQGGAGWTFLFGCVAQSIRQFEQSLESNPTFKNKPIAVLGAGCYGLLTALMLKQKGYCVHIIAKETETIASFKAAGFFFPRPRKCSTAQERATFEALGMESYATYLQIIKGSHPFITQGVKLLPAYYGLDIDPGFAPYIDQGLIASPEKVTITFNTEKTYPAMAYKTIFIDATLLMKELHRVIADSCIEIVPATINSFNDCDESIIFNCTGLGAKELTNDSKIIPVQGHLITLQHQPSSDQLQYMINVKVTMISPEGKVRDELIYYAPKDTGILGITFIRGQNSLDANPHEFDRLLQRSRDFFGG